MAADLQSDWLTEWRAEDDDCFVVGDLFRMRYYLARRIYPMRNEITPLSQARPAHEQITWAQWFERKHRVPLDQYVKDAQKYDFKRLVIEAEKARFGWSPLESHAGEGGA